jgi:hypothetical protein
MLDVATLAGAPTRVGPADITAVQDNLRGQSVGRIDMDQKALWRFCNSALRFEGAEMGRPLPI